MKLRNRILAIVLTFVLMLSVMPLAFAAEQVTVTLSTPSGTTTQIVEAGSSFVLPTASDFDNYIFICWVTKPYELCEASEIGDFYFSEESVTVNLDTTYYALYYIEESLPVPYFFWTGEYDDYTGEYAIVGVNLDFETGAFFYDNPLAFGENGQVIPVTELGGDMTLGEYEFSTSATNIVYDFQIQNDGTYTIRNLDTGKYLSASGTKVAFVSDPDAYSYWAIELDEYGYDCIRNAKNMDLYLLYDFYEEFFAIYDNSQYYYETFYPVDYFYINLYARETVTYKYTTEVSGVEPEEPPIELPDQDCPAAKYSDLDLDAWYHDGVDFVLNNGYMNGVSATAFRPNGTLNRAMVATVLYRIAGEPAVEGTSPFSDVVAGQWYTEAVIWAQTNGIVTGYTDNTFRPDREITRQEMAVMLARYAKLAGIEISGGADLSAYPDANAVASWAKEAVEWSVGNGLINGVYSGGVSSLKPENNATRAQFATIMMRYMTMN